MTNELSDSNVSEKTAFATPHKWADEMDFILPLGNACRPARQLQAAGLRTFSTPLDWMMRYPLNLAVDLIARGFEGFFSSPEEDAEKGKGKGNRYVVDKATGMISMHGFSWKKSIEEELPAFYEKMLRRGQRLKNKILKSRRIGILMNRAEKEETILAFAKKISDAFPQQRFYILNLRDDKTLSGNQRSRRIIAETGSYSVCEIRLNDTHEDGDDPKKNPNFWLGNVPAWQEILKQEFSLKKDEDSQIKVSVIIPCYNVEKYLRECLDSVVNQTLKEIEIICVDDGSTDSTPQILEEYAAKDSRFTILHQKNQFAGVARNNGMKIARGKYLCFLDSDDVFDLKMLEKAFHHAEKCSAEIVLWSARLFSEKISESEDAPGILNFDKIPSKSVFSLRDIPEHAFSFCWGCPWNKLFSRQLVETQKLFWSDTRVSNDIFFVFTALLSAKRISCLKDAFVFHRWRYSKNSIQGSMNSAPLDFIKASKAIYDFINAKGLRPLFGNTCAKDLIGNATGYVNRAIGENKKIILRALRDGGFESFGVSNKNIWNFESWKIRFFISAMCVDNPAISIIIPVYNTEKFIEKCLDSVLCQTLYEIEVICINDGSTDNSLSILEKYATKDSRLTVFSQENKGAGLARNVGLSKARGEFVCFMDPDDWYPEKDILETLYVAAQKENVKICGGSLEEHNPDGAIVRNFKAEDLKWGETFYENKLVSAIDYPYDWGYTRFIFSRKFLAENDIKFPRYTRYEDPPFFVKALLNAGQFYALKKITYAYRVSYKPVDYYKDPKKCEDIFRGVRDCIVLAKRYNSYKLAERFFRFWTNKWLVSQWLPTFNAHPQVQEAILSAWDELPQKPTSAVSVEWREIYTQRKYSSPLVSIVIPVYNVEKYLRECLDSVCGQDLREIEIICVNDGSTDGSLAILEEYAAKDSRIKIINQANAGLGAARNAGLSQAGGEFVYFMDSDDVSPQGALSKMYSELKRDGLDLLFFSATSFYETPELEQSHAHYKTYYTRKEFDICTGQELGVKFQGVRSNFASACCYCSRRDFWLGNGIRFPEDCLYEDNAAFWSILKNAQRAKSISEPLFQRRVRQGSIMTKRKLDFRNFAGYAKIISIFDKISHTGKALIPEFEAVLKGNANSFSQTLIRFYQQISPEDRTRSRELLCNELRDSEWLNPVRENIAKIEGIDLPMAGNLTVPAGNPVATQALREKPCSSVVASTPECSKKLPRLLVRLGAMFIWNKAARKRWRERHMDLTPKNGIDIHEHPELRRDSALKRFAVRFAALFILNKGARKRFREAHLNLIPRDGIDVNLRGRAKSDSALKRFGVRVVSLFIFSKKKRKAFRARHMDLTPKNGVDVNALSPEERRLRKQKKRERNPLRRLFNAVVPASRSKVAHTEKRIIRHMEWQTQQILSAIKGAQAQSERRFNELKQEIARAQKGLSTNIKAELAQVRERADVVSREQLARMDAQKKFFAERAEILSRELDGLSSALTAGLSSQTAAVSNLASAQKALRASVIESYAALEKRKPNSLEFRTFGDLAHCIRTNLHKLPSDADLVVGVPRSGMIPAYTIALFMNKRCCSLDEFLSDTEISTGARPVGAMSIRKVLVVDDSCFSGSALARTKERLKAVAGKYEFVFAAVYGRTESADKLDCCLELVDGRRVWQWNYLNHSLAGSACFDMDGVLCADPTPEENDDGAKYLNFIKNAKPLYIPSYKIRAIVTSRLEKYREPTETWLREHGVQYDELVMLNMATAEERRRANCHAAFKAEAYKARERTTLFVESEERQAKEIAFLSGKDVLCVATDKLY